MHISISNTKFAYIDEEHFHTFSVKNSGGSPRHLKQVELDMFKAVFRKGI